VFGKTQQCVLNQIRYQFKNKLFNNQTQLDGKETPNLNIIHESKIKVQLAITIPKINAQPNTNYQIKNMHQFKSNNIQTVQNYTQ
jgi:hypothetical protein